MPQPPLHLPEMSLRCQPCVPVAESPPTHHGNQKGQCSKSRQRDCPPWPARLCRVLPGLRKPASCRELEPHSSSTSTFWGDGPSKRFLGCIAQRPPQHGPALALVKNSMQRKVENFKNSSWMVKKAKAADREHQCSQHHPCCSHVPSRVRASLDSLPLSCSSSLLVSLYKAKAKLLPLQLPSPRKQSWCERAAPPVPSCSDSARRMASVPPPESFTWLLTPTKALKSPLGFKLHSSYLLLMLLNNCMGNAYSDPKHLCGWGEGPPWLGRHQKDEVPVLFLAMLSASPNTQPTHSTLQKTNPA